MIVQSADIGFFITVLCAILNIQVAIRVNELIPWSGFLCLIVKATCAYRLSQLLVIVVPNSLILHPHDKWLFKLKISYFL